MASSEGILGYSLMGIALLDFLTMCSLCGICRSKDKAYQEDLDETGSPMADEIDEIPD